MQDEMRQTGAMIKSNLNTVQLRALVWLKWRLFLNALRSRRGTANRVASALGTLVAVAVSLMLATGLGLGAYFVVRNRSGAHAARFAQDLATGASVDALFLLFGMASMIYLVWATAPLSFGGGNQFDPGRLLLYPISLRRLFALDLLSELTSLASIFAAPSIFAISLGAGLARGSVSSALVVAVLATLFGISLAKLLSTCFNTLMQMKRTRGEAVLAVLGVVGALSGLVLGQSDRLISHYQTFPAALRLTPMGAMAAALAGGTEARGGATYALSLLVLLSYTLITIVATYKIARRGLEGSGGARKSAVRTEAEDAVAAKALGWRLPFVSTEVSTVFEKELRYALRNAQLRTMAVMPIIMTLSFKLIGSRRGGSPGRGVFTTFAPYTDGVSATFSMLYVFLVMSALSANLFGYEGSGMRAYVLAPVARRTILAGKNLAVLVVSFVLAVAVVSFNALLYRDLTPRAFLFTALCFVFFAVTSLSVGNWFSIRFPKRLEFGRHMNASGLASLLLLPIFIGIGTPPAIAVFAGYRAQSLLVEYVILAAFAVAGVAVYFLLLERQGRLLAERELDILEAVTGRGDD